MRTPFIALLVSCACVLFLTWVACTPNASATLSQDSPTAPTASPNAPNADCGVPQSGPYVPLCAHLVALGCSAGVSCQCSGTFMKAEREGLDLKANCLGMALTKEAARACGTVACP
jgi:hypothetical protein